MLHLNYSKLNIINIILYFIYIIRSILIRIGTIVHLIEKLINGILNPKIK